MAKKIKLTKDLIDKHIDKFLYSYLHNPIYGKNVFFFEGCVGPRINRNQLLGYLGAFSGSFYELTSEIDICVIPVSSSQNLKNDSTDNVIDTINGKMNTYNNDTDRYTNSISNTLIIPEIEFFQFLSKNLLKNDEVKISTFNRINFTYDLEV